MQIKMLKTSIGSATALGNKTMDYVEGETYTMMEDWQKVVANTFIQQGWAQEVGGKKEMKVDAPTETKRARNDDGTLKGDAPATEAVNEAWEGGQAPKKTSKKTK